MSGHDISKREKTNEDIYLLVQFYVKTLAYYQDRFNCICFLLVSVIGELRVHPNKGYSLLQYCARTAAHSTFKLLSFVTVIVGLCFTVVFEFFQFDLRHWKSKDFESYIHIYYKPMVQFMLMLYHLSTAYTTFLVFTIILAVFFALVSKLIIDSILYENYDLLLYSCTYCSINSSMVRIVW